MHTIRRLAACLIAAAALAGGAPVSADSTITYQGQLQDNGSPVTGEVDMSFELFDAETGESSVAGPIAVPDVGVSDGLFRVELDFGAGAFDGNQRWLEVTAESDTLAPRQLLTAAPMAVHAINVPDDYWRLGGNSGTTPGTDFIGTSDATPLEIHVDGRRAMQITPNADSNIGPNILGGHEANSIGAGVRLATIGGGGAGTHPNTVLDDFGTIGGGLDNIVDGEASSVGGGLGNTAADTTSTVAGGHTNNASGPATAIGGGFTNTASGEFATVGGGWNNEAGADFATIAGGGPSDTDNPGTTNNVVYDHYGTIGGGAENRVGTDNGDPSDSPQATIAGGAFNVATRDGATVGGGLGNEATNSRATIGGGGGNEAAGFGSVIAGGEFNDTAGAHPTVGGGRSNSASGSYATVPGGRQNEAAGTYSLAAGRFATIDATHHGTFLWADRSNFGFHSAAENEFAARATGGVRFVTAIDGTGDPTAGVKLAAGGSSWSAISDRNAKTAIEPVDTRSVLERVIELPISEYSYKTQDKSIRHMGPMAQDFYPLFSLGEDELRINAINLAGVALAAIQGLQREIASERDRNDRLQEKIRRLEQRTQRIDELARRNAELEARLAALEAAMPAAAQTVRYRN